MLSNINDKRKDNCDKTKTKRTSLEKYTKIIKTGVNTIEDAKAYEDKFLYRYTVKKYDKEIKTLMEQLNNSEGIEKNKLERDIKELENRKKLELEKFANTKEFISERNNIKEIVEDNKKYILPEDLINNLPSADNYLNDYLSSLKKYKSLYFDFYKDELFSFKEIPLYEASDNHYVKYCFKKLLIPQYLHSFLYPFQLSCLSWLYSLFLSNEGGIIADDMGIGKTIQVIAYISALFYSSIVDKAVIIVPTTLINQWLSEFKRFNPFVRIIILHKIYFKKDKKRVEESIKDIIDDANNSNIKDYNDILYENNESDINKHIPYVIIISYDYFLKYSHLISSPFIFADEAHKVKNAETLISKAINKHSASNKIIVTGTPLQNKMKELHTLFDIVCPGKLGSYTTFFEEFEQPITNTVKNRRREIINNKNLNKEIDSEYKTILLKSIINKNIIRRTKALIRDQLPNKKEKIIFCNLTKIQEYLYSRSTENMKFNNFLVEIDGLRKIVNHPLIFYDKKYKEIINSHLECEEELKNINILNNNETSDESDKEDNASILDTNISDNLKERARRIINMSSKLSVLISLLLKMLEAKDKILIFSQSLKMLDLLEDILKDIFYNKIYLRIDGNTAVGNRTAILNTFSNNMEYQILLLTTRVGGVGLNITAANRIIIYDPDWNPSTDNQAMQRIYRIGQNRDVKIYRLITKDTIEEIIYESQIFKQLLSKTILKDKIVKSIKDKNLKKTEKDKMKNSDGFNNKTSNLLKIANRDKIKAMEYYQSKILLSGEELLKFIYLREEH